MSTPSSSDQKSTAVSDSKNEQITGCSTYASFGDKCVTATTNSHGHLLQITRYLNNEPSAFCCVDLTGILTSHRFTHRMQKLQNCCTDPNSGVGVRIEHSTNVDVHTEKTSEAVPKLDFVHDRWPHFVTTTPEFHLETQYFVSEKTVYQIYTLKLRQEVSIAETTNIKLFLRNLSLKVNNDEKNSNSNNNDTQDSHYEEYSNHLSPEKNYIRRTRKIRNTVPGNQNVVALFITPFINKSPQKFHVEPKSGDCHIILENSVLKDLRNGKKVKVTLAYQLELISSGATEPKHSVSSESLSRIQTVLKEPSKIPALTQDDRFNVNLRRNLEHILSVCSIPVSSDADEKNPSIALTCGDISGHRISTEASFHAFQFLLLTLEDINNKSRCVYQSENDSIEDSYMTKMRSRILEVCQGHLKWLIRENAKSNSVVSSLNNAGSDGPIVDDDSNPSLLEQSLISTSFQIIKAAEFCRIAMSDVSKEKKLEFANEFRTIVKNWTAALDGENKGSHFVFPNLREEREQRVFHLSDQAIIWWAAKSAEELGLDSELQVNESSGTYSRRNRAIYSSKEIRANLLKRFTIGNSTFEKSMIAMSRSSNETRFQLQAKDTVLFYAMDLGLFDQDDSAESTSCIWQNKIEAWRCVVDYQKECEHDRIAHWDWEQPLRCALALIMASKNKQMTLQAIPQVQQEARNALLRSSSANGLFSSHLDENERSAMDDGEAMSDIFWSTTFEVPYVILRYTVTRSPSELPRLSITATTPSLQGSSVSPSILSTESTTSDPVRELSRNTTPPMPPIEILSSCESPLMKHGVLFTNIIDLGKIVEIPDEWLYNEPRFFNFHATLSGFIVDEFCIGASKEHADESSKFSLIANVKRLSNKERSDKHSSDIHKNAIIGNHTGICAMKVMHGAAILDYRTRESDPMGYVIDVPRTARHKKKKEYDSVEISSSLSLIEHLNTRRTPTLAKKRIFHFSRTSWNIALICYLASSEPREISCFFDRHASLSPYFFEDTIGTLNKWVTELHLPFYQILSPTNSSQFIKSVLEPRNKRTIPVSKMIHLPYSDSKNPKGAKILSRAVISFRFDGDLLDRYWTCHLIEYRPQQRDDPKEMSFHIPTQPISGALKSNPWRQRRVLELLLFDRSLREILRCTEEILNEAKSTLRAAKDIRNYGCSYEDEECKAEFSDNHNRRVKASRDVFRSNDSLYKMQEVLQEVEDDLSENLAKMQLWKNRQNGRGPERPRWTLKDEYRYGGAISRLQASNNFYMEELVRCRAKILAFNSQLTREIDASRSDWEMRTTNNVRLFTYVTVVFLPTSFATGVFSMSGVPTMPVIRLVVITAVIALFLTILTLINAKNLERMLRYVRDGIYQFRHGLIHCCYGFKQSISDAGKLTREITLESGLSIVNFFLRWLHRTYEWANEYSASAQETRPTSVRYLLISILQVALSYIIYRLAFKIYMPLRALTKAILSDAKVYDPVGDMSFNDDHPIQQARFNYHKLSDTASGADSDPLKEDLEELFDDLGQRATDLFKSWQERLKPKLDDAKSREVGNETNLSHVCETSTGTEKGGFRAKWSLVRSKMDDIWDYLYYKLA
ncbi:uncharacterized protein Triagg1_522 [Trichoderma aggressivum f. europaeum]|uniref:Uncharacterized protein n=1 Tax=Trichoderma aggressivum f. europaeum TaxID=173218 RepID=A0AAE1IM88_9HYPO|nr:hypothetical protein Triagg1_522 [Trichoderma aggressivum f. europaeum]